jgi:TonB family protein
MNTTDKKSMIERFRILLTILFSLTVISLCPFLTLANLTPSLKNNIYSPVQNSTENNQKKQQNPVVREKSHLSIDQNPAFKGGFKEMVKFVNLNLHYPKLAKRNGVVGRVIVNFVIDIQGKISNVKSISGIGSGCDEEAVRIVKAMPNWIPGRQNGKIVPVLYWIQIDFELSNSKKDHVVLLDEYPQYTPCIYEKDRPLLAVEQNPEFKGGYKVMEKYLKDKMIYPISAKKEGIQGIVFVQFVVERNGKITNVKILRGIDKACDEEVIRLVKSMPHWVPGRQDGKVARVLFAIPVKFKLE